MVKDPAGYERTDISPRIVSRFAVGLVIVCIVAAVVVWMLERRLDRAYSYPGTASRTGFPGMVAPQPQLQTNSPEDLRKMRAGEEKILQSYGWVDRKAGVVRIPIERAMELTLERGLPVRKDSPPAAAKPMP